jgi:hypothetical protein
MNNKGVHMTDENKEQANQKSFMHKPKNVTCYKCGKDGHYANKCPSGDSNANESSTRSNLLSNRSNHSRPNHIAWSAQYNDGLTLLEARSMTHRCVLDEHENTSKENPEWRTRMYEYDWILNTIEYDSESKLNFLL